MRNSPSSWFAAPRRAAGLALAVGIALAFTACQGSSSPRPAAPTLGAPQPAMPVVAQPGVARPDAVTGQIDRGAVVFARQCAQCHGADGSGSQGAPRLMGPGALPLDPPRGARMRTGRFPTAMELGMFIKNTMPPGGPATPPQDVAAVMAYMLASNGMRPAQAISPATAGSIPIR